MRKPLNECGGCGEDFTSVSLFDRHRVGVHEYEFDLDHEDGRRCLHPHELRDKGFEQDDNGRWFDPVKRERAREFFGSSEVSRTRFQPVAPPGG